MAEKTTVEPAARKAARTLGKLGIFKDEADVGVPAPSTLPSPSRPGGRATRWWVGESRPTSGFPVKIMEPMQ